MFPKRKATRIPEFNYASRHYYFVTICVHHFHRWFGNVVDGKVVLSEYGRIVEDAWHDLPNHYFNCELRDSVIMPNHVHGIIAIVGEACLPDRQGFKPSRNLREGHRPSRTKRWRGLCEMVRAFKTFSSKRIHLAGEKHFHWQRSFYEHIIRNDEDMWRIQEYIFNNPLQWELDEYYLKAAKPD